MNITCLFAQFSMTNDSKLKEDSFTLVTSQRRNKKKHTKKRLELNQILKPSEEDSVDEESVIKYVITINFCGSKLYKVCFLF